jgi:hypothetical protein
MPEAVVIPWALPVRLASLIKVNTEIARICPEREPRPAVTPQHLDFMPKKLPRQRRSRDTFDALVDACTLLLPVRG